MNEKKNDPLKDKKSPKKETHDASQRGSGPASKTHTAESKKEQERKQAKSSSSGIKR